MDETTARALLNELKTITDSCNKLSVLSERIANEDERRAFRRQLGDLMAKVDGEIIRPLEREHPHLEGIAVEKD